MTMRNEFDANLSLQPMTRVEPAQIEQAACVSTINLGWIINAARAVVTVILFAAIGVMLGLGA